jgi:two-component system phosphate regulon sensor histidine kinase PhoR
MLKHRQLTSPKPRRRTSHRHRQTETAWDREEERRQLEKKEEFFMAASHQLKAPVAIIQWCLQSVLEAPPPDPQVQKLVSKALGQAEAMKDLISDMLHVFRLMRDRDQNSYVQVDMNALLQEIYRQFLPSAQNRQVHLRMGAVEVLPPVFADPTYLKQAFVNLVDNAIKYTPAGRGVTLAARHRPHRHEVEIMVTDEGIGIAEADQSRLFTEFFRAASAQDMVHDGTGLGLVLVKHIIEKFGGEILYESQVGKGTAFTVRLPTGE